MARFKLDLRPLLRSVATAIQDANLSRLLSGETVTGDSVTPRAEAAPAQTSSRKRLRLFGGRYALRDLASTVGIKTGTLTKDLVRRANIKLGRVGFKIVPSAAVRVRFFVFVGGDKHQPARPISGVTGEQLDEAAEKVSQEARDQFARSLKDRGYGFR